jgi:hypothetical protein
MRLNTNQKIICIITLLLIIISLLFFIPFREFQNTEIVYKSIFNTYGKIDFIRFIIQTLLIVFVGLLLFFSSSITKNINWQSTVVKRNIRREFKYLGIYIITSSIIGLAFYLINLNQVKSKQAINRIITEKNSSRDKLIEILQKNDQEKRDFVKELLDILKYNDEDLRESIAKIKVDNKFNYKDDNNYVDEIESSELLAPSTSLDRFYFNLIEISNDTNKVKILVKVIKNARPKNRIIIHSHSQRMNKNKFDLDNFLKDDLGIQQSLAKFSDSIFNKNLSSFKLLANAPSVFKGKINSFERDKNISNKISIQSNIIIQYQNKFNSLWSFNDKELNNIYFYFAMILFVILFLLRYAFYGIRMLTGYLKIVE